MPEEELMEEIARALREQDSGYGRLYEDTLPSPKKKKRREPGGMTAFFAAFGASMLILGAVLLGAFSLSGREGPEDTLSGGQSDLSLLHYRPTAADAGTLLILCGGEGDPGRAFFWLARIDPQNGVMTILSLPDGTVTPEGTLGDAAAGSASHAADAVAALLGMEEVPYVRLSKADAAQVVDALGGMEWTFRDRFTSDTLDIPPGEHLLDGETLLALMEVSGAQGLPEAAEILTAFLGQKFTEDAFNKDDSLFELLAGHSSGQLSVVSYYDHKPYIRWFLHLGGGYRTVTLSGGPGEVRALSEGEVAYAREQLGLDG